MPQESKNPEVENHTFTRRTLLRGAAPAIAAGVVAPYWFTAESTLADEPRSKSDRHEFACIGNGWRWGQIVGGAMRHGDVLAVCDVDRGRAAAAKIRVGGKADVYSDYRKVIHRKDIDSVIIATPDHWHTKIAVEAMQAGKDVYCEKPLTLTIDEGNTLCRVAKKTGRVLQVGTQQRSEFRSMFLKAIAITQSGRLGKKIKATCNIGATTPGGPFKTTNPPAGLDWNTWLGQAPKVDYCPERCHIKFRSWYEYAGGTVTDLGAHMVDIAQWALGHQETGPVKIEARGTLPKTPNGYNTPTDYDATLTFADGNSIRLIPGKGFGLLIEGDQGRIYVNRGRLTGKPVEQLKPADHDDINHRVLALYRGKKPGDHMRNFFECVKDRKLPISDVFTHHRTVSSCHLANLGIRLGRDLKWDPKRENFVDDAEATAMLSRKQRKGFEISG